MISTDKTVIGLPISYLIEDNGYSIYLGGNLWITQYDEYAKPMNGTKSLEENCLLQIEALAKQDETEQIGV